MRLSQKSSALLFSFTEAMYHSSVSPLLEGNLYVQVLHITHMKTFTGLLYAHAYACTYPNTAFVYNDEIHIIDDEIRIIDYVTTAQTLPNASNSPIYTIHSTCSQILVCPAS